MDKYIFNDSNGLWYELCGDYYLPCLTLPEDEHQIGIWGQRHKRYLKQEHRIIYETMLSKGTLFQYLEGHVLLSTSQSRETKHKEQSQR